MSTNAPYYLKANYHTHTARCGHARGEERAYIEAAISSGMKTLGFADHGPYLFQGDFVSGIRMTMEQIEDYVGVISRLREEYKQDIEILIGYELEYFPGLFHDTLKTLCDMPIDYLILGQHFVPCEDGGAYAGAATDKKEVLELYTALAIAGMETGAFSYLCHPDLVPYNGPREDWQACMRRICRASLATDTPLEINMLGLSGHRVYPSREFCLMAKEMGCRFIVGCDAHWPDFISDTSARQDLADFLAELQITPMETLPLKDPRKGLYI